MAKHMRDEYRIEGEIGSGGMAKVFKAIQKSLDRPVAIKELKKDYLGDERIVRRFVREAKTAASFQHENIVHIYDFWSKPECAIVMEYVDGTSLSEIISKTGPLPVDIGVMIAIQVCNALSYAHMRGVVHRDIKPSNIMIRRNGEVKLMDFGIAQVRSLAPLTMPGTLMGTPSYMSPEQVLGDPLDFRSDIFSLGIVFYEMFTGHKPFTDEQTQSITAKIVQSRFLSPRRLNRHVPRKLQRLIKKCLKKKPGKRLSSVQRVAARLGKLIQGRTDKPTSLTRISDYLVSQNLVENLPEQETLVLSRESFGMGAYTKVLIAGALILLFLLGGAGYYFWKKGKLSVPQLPALFELSKPQTVEPAPIPPPPKSRPRSLRARGR